MNATFAYRPGSSRWAALTLAIIWTVTCLSAVVNHPWSTSSLGVNYVTLYVIPMGLLAIHVLYPTVFSWSLIALAVLVPLCWASVEAIKGEFDYLYGPKHMQYRLQWVIAVTGVGLTLVCSFFYILRPRDKGIG